MGSDDACLKQRPAQSAYDRRDRRRGLRRRRRTRRRRPTRQSLRLGHRPRRRSLYLRGRATTDSAAWTCTPTRSPPTRAVGSGQEGYGGDGGPARQATLNQPYELRFDQTGGLYIADISNHRIRRVDLTTGTITTFAGTGEKDLTPDGAPLSGTPLNGPPALAFRPLHDLSSSSEKAMLSTGSISADRPSTTLPGPARSVPAAMVDPRPTPRSQAPRGSPSPPTEPSFSPTRKTTRFDGSARTAASTRSPVTAQLLTGETETRCNAASRAPTGFLSICLGLSSSVTARTIASVCWLRHPLPGSSASRIEPATARPCTGAARFRYAQDNCWIRIATPSGLVSCSSEWSAAATSKTTGAATEAL